MSKGIGTSKCTSLAISSPGTRDGRCSRSVANSNNVSRFATASMCACGENDWSTLPLLSILSSDVRETVATIPVSIFAIGLLRNVFAAARASSDRRAGRMVPWSSRNPATMRGSRSWRSAPSPARPSFATSRSSAFTCSCCRTTSAASAWASVSRKASFIAPTL